MKISTSSPTKYRSYRSKMTFKRRKGSCQGIWSLFFLPTYSPDLNPCDFYLWGYLKGRVYTNPVPKTIGDLKKNIRREVRKIKPDTLKKVSENVLTRLQKVLSTKGSWIEHIING